MNDCHLFIFTKMIGHCAGEISFSWHSQLFFYVGGKQSENSMPLMFLLDGILEYTVNLLKGEKTWGECTA